MDKILSIIVPSYNMEAYLPKCLGSLIIEDKELFQKVEVIIVNDGSKDSTSMIAHEFSEKYPDVFKVIDKANGNYGSCINAALPIAKGVFVKILDADDSFDTKAFTKMLTMMKKSELDAEQVDLFLTDFVEVDETGSEKILHSIQLPLGRTLNVEDVDCIPLLYMHSIAYRTENLRRMQYRQTEGISYTDTEWTYYPMRNVMRIRYEKLPVYRYLVGRIGQTVAPEVQKRSVWMVAEIARLMVENYPDMILGANHVLSRYIDDFVVMMNCKVYNISILKIHDKENDRKLVGFDKMLSEHSDHIYRKVMDALVSRRIRFSYGRYWRRCGSSNTFVMRAFRLYRCAVAFISKVRFVHK